MTPHLSRDEGSDSYAGEVVCAAQTRVIICRDSLQWISQRRAPGQGPGPCQGQGQGQGQRSWRDQAYLTSRKPLEALWRSAVGAVPNQISDLPAHFPRKTIGNNHD